LGYDREGLPMSYFVDKDGQFLGQFLDGAEPPEGAIEVPLRPSVEHQWQNGAWVHVPPDPAEVLAQWRSQATLPRSAFILAALDSGILTEMDAEQAVNDWPSGWDAFFDGLPARDRIAAKAEWASITHVRRNAPLVAQLAAFKGLTDEQVDAIFGINV